MLLPCDIRWFQMDFRVGPFIPSELSALGVIDGRDTVFFGDYILQMLDMTGEPVIIIIAEGNEFSFSLAYSMISRNTHPLIDLFNPKHVWFVGHQ